MTSSPPRSGTRPCRRNERFHLPRGLQNFKGTSSTHQRVGLLCRPCAGATLSPSIRNPIHGLVRGFTYLKKRSPPPKRTLFLAGLPVPDGINNFMGTFSTHQRVGLLRRPCFGAKPLPSIRNPLHSPTHPTPSILHRP